MSAEEPRLSDRASLEAGTRLTICFRYKGEVAGVVTWCERHLHLYVHRHGQTGTATRLGQTTYRIFNSSLENISSVDPADSARPHNVFLNSFIIPNTLQEHQRASGASVNTPRVSETNRSLSFKKNLHLCDIVQYITVTTLCCVKLWSAVSRSSRTRETWETRTRHSPAAPTDSDIKRSTTEVKAELHACLAYCTLM